jgi:hypothetical protein
LTFNPTLEIPLTDEVSVSSDKLMIQKMNKEINVLKKNVLILTKLNDDTNISSDKPMIQKMIEEMLELKKNISTLTKLNDDFNDLMSYVELPILKYNTFGKGKYGSKGSDTKFTVNLMIPINSPNIKIIKGQNRIPCLSNTTVHAMIDTSIEIQDTHTFNANFKKIMCKTLSIDEISLCKDMNLPQSIIELTISRCANINSIDISHMSNLRILSFADCPSLKNIYENIKMLNVSTIIIKGCPAFLDANILTHQKITVVMN